MPLSVHFRVYPQVIVVSGNTYTQRELLKSLGGRFDGNNKSWRLPNTADNRTRLQELCDACGGGELPCFVAEQDEPQQGVSARARSEQESERYKQLRQQKVSEATTSEAGGLSIAELLERADTSLREKFPYPIWVVGEVQNLGHKGHIYLQLVEGQEGKHQTLSVSAVIWKNFIKPIEERCGADFLQDGLQIRCLCDVQLYRERAALSLRIREIDPAFTHGALALAREKLLRELRAAGKDRVNKNLTLTRVPQRIGLITAAGSRAYGDFCDQLRALQVPVQVFFRPTPMQGEDVLEEVPQAIAALHACDVIVITRGGGSASDLRWFDSAEVAAGIVAARVPIVAAIGHHEDLCVAEEISFMRQKTPTAAADYLAGLFVELEELCQALRTDLSVALQHSWQTVQARYANASSRLSREALAWQRRGDVRLAEMAAAVISAAQEGLQQRHNHHRDLASLLHERAQRQLATHGATLQAREKQLLAVDPRSWLAKGWARIYANRGLVKSVTQVARGEQVRAVMDDGQLKLQVVDVEPSTRQEEEK